MYDIPTLQDVKDANERIAPYVVRTPLHRYLSLDQLLGTETYVKHENYQCLGAFKVRGGVNLISQMGAEDRGKGVVGASTGNHGQSIAFAAKAFGSKAIIVVPEGANPGKVQSMRDLGAEVIFYGAVFDDSLLYAERLSKEEGYRYIHSVNEPKLVAGVATYTLEIMEDLPDVDAIIVPIGGGSGACGACIVAKAIQPGVQVIGVQAAAAPAVYHSWKNRQIEEASVETVAEGIATRTAYSFALGILVDQLDEFILVSEDELNQAVVLHLEKTHNLTEHAGAASLAAALKIKDRLQGKKVVLVVSGGNISMEHLKDVLVGA